MNSTLRKVFYKSLGYSYGARFSTNIGSLLQSRLSSNPLQNAIRFENQNKTWTYKEIERHSDAVAYGLLELGYKRGDRMIFWVDRGFSSEIVMAQIGLAKIGVTVVPITSSDVSEVESALRDTESKGLLFSPNTKVGETRRADVIADLIPEIKKAYDGTPLKASRFPKLKNLIHTGFNSIPGTIKYKQFLVYGNPNFQTNRIPDNIDESTPLFYVNNKSVSLSDIRSKNEEFRSANNLSENDVVLVIGDMNSPATFAYGVYNSLAYGNYTILAGNEKFKTTVEKMAVQHPNLVVINEKLTPEDLQTVAPADSTNSVRNFLVSGADESQVRNVFGGKQTSSYSPYFS